MDYEDETTVASIGVMEPPDESEEWIHNSRTQTFSVDSSMLDEGAELDPFGEGSLSSAAPPSSVPDVLPEEHSDAAIEIDTLPSAFGDNTMRAAPEPASPTAPDYTHALDVGHDTMDVDIPVADPAEFLEIPSDADEASRPPEPQFAEASATAVYNVSHLANSPEALGADFSSPGKMTAPDLVARTLEPEPEFEPAGPAPQATESSSARSRGRVSLSSILNGGITLALLLGTVVVAAYLMVQTGRLDPATVGLDGVFPQDSAPLRGGLDDVYPETMRSILYPSARGASLLVFAGEVVNLGQAKRDDLWVRAFLLDDDGALVAENVGPVGIQWQPPELNQIADREQLSAMQEEKSDGKGDSLEPGEHRPFMVVIPSPPDSLHRFHHRVELVRSPKAALAAQRALGEKLAAEKAAVEKGGAPGRKKRPKRRRGSGLNRVPRDTGSR